MHSQAYLSSAREVGMPFLLFGFIRKNFNMSIFVEEKICKTQPNRLRNLVDCGLIITKGGIGIRFSACICVVHSTVCNQIGKTSQADLYSLQ